jgi:uncharacterized RDD family membrane protein YckC
MRPTDRTGQYEGVDFLAATPAKANSTLIEFPGSRAKLPEWRKELSERVREVQARKAREAELEAESDPQPLFSLALEPSPNLGLVPTPEVNPIVAKALERIENARRTVMISRSSGGTALAVARAVEEPVMATPAPFIAPIRPVAVPPPFVEPELDDVDGDSPQVVIGVGQAPLAIEPEIEELPVVARVTAKEPTDLFSATDAAMIQMPIALPDAMVASTVIEIENLPVELAEPTSVIRLRRHNEPILDETESPLTVRAAAGVLDLMLVIFVTSPFAAVIELSGGDWSDPRVWGALGAIACILMVLYQASAVALSGRTWGMSLFSLRVADEAFGLYPTFGQSLLRAFVYLFSLLPAGLPLLAAVFNDDGMALHDRASATVVVRHE